MAKTYGVELVWLYKGRYEKSDYLTVDASNLRAGVGKAIAKSALEGFREKAGAVLRIKATVLLTATDKKRINGEEGE